MWNIFIWLRIGTTLLAFCETVQFKYILKGSDDGV
jgi:hypothetical protein